MRYGMHVACDRARWLPCTTSMAEIEVQTEQAEWVEELVSFVFGEKFASY